MVVRRGAARRDGSDPARTSARHGERQGRALLRGNRPTPAGLRSFSVASTSGRRQSLPRPLPRSFRDGCAWVMRYLGSALRRSSTRLCLFPSPWRNAWKRAGRRRRSPALALTLGVVAGVFLPFVILSPGGVWHSLSIQLSRPLQVESLGAALLLVGHHVFGFGLAGETSHGSQNVAGNAADWLAVASTVLQAGCSDLDLGSVRTQAGRRRGAHSLDRSRAPVPSSPSGRCCRRSS